LLTGRTEHHITVLLVDYNSRNNCSLMTSVFTVSST